MVEATVGELLLELSQTIVLVLLLTEIWIRVQLRGSYWISCWIGLHKFLILAIVKIASTVYRRSLGSWLSLNRGLWLWLSLWWRLSLSVGRLKIWNSVSWVYLSLLWRLNWLNLNGEIELT